MKRAFGAALSCLSAATACAMVPACTSSDAQPAAVADASVEAATPRPQVDAAPEDAATDIDASTACNDLTFEGSPIAETGPTDDAGVATDAGAPTDTGGTIVDGTYVLVTRVAYGSVQPDPSLIRETLRIKGTSIVHASETESSSGPTFDSFNGTITLTGTSLHVTLACIVPAPPHPGAYVMANYTATADMLTLHYANGLAGAGDGAVATYRLKK